MVDPYGLVAKAGVWYLIAAAGGEPRLYRVSQIEAAQAVPEPTLRPAGLDLDRLWEILRRRFEERGPGVRVELRVRLSRQSLLLRLAVPQLVGPAPPAAESRGEWVELALDFVAEGAARAILLGFAGDVVVLSPQSLRAGMVEAAREVIAVYANQA